ncbi:hypothetical protein OV090_15065 [Nannocystis sp. RBIL2]|uniref:hypothetical protein n=1 Tax=Nannocystis sp. RBIL2 TaxID=2996788 RepID=UPI00227140A0|nr:hypothetical protein [Nannocystis sp. RBIL2]MCY1066098.1 hypothetical protein [Nannocystis sp. RBIL2]
MFYRTSIAVAWLVLSVACQPDDSASLCPLTGPVRLAAPPDGWLFDTAAEPRISGSLDGLVFYTYDGREPVQHWQVEVCGGEPQLLPGPRPYLRQLTKLRLPSGEVTYYLDELTQKVLVDRDDLDEPRALAGLSPGDYRARFWADRMVLARQQTPGYSHNYAAGLGGSTHALYAHDGAPEHPAVFLADEVALFDPNVPDLLALRDDGELLRFDGGTGEATTLLDAARNFHASAPYLIWQEMGDDIAEPIYLRNLDTGDERLLLVNDFCQRSWSRDPEFPGVNAGRWRFDPEAGLAALVGPGETLVAMHRLADGAALEVPAHDKWERWDDGVVLLQTHEPGARVTFTLWDPVGGAEHVWYRGPVADEPAFFEYDGEGVDYFVFGVPERKLGSMWRYDIASGQHAEVLPRMTYFHSRLDDGRYMVEFPRPDDHDGLVDLVVIDRDTRSYTTLAERVYSPWPVRTDEDPLAYAWLDLLGPQPGLWMTPLPPK